MPVEGADANGVSLGFVFAVAALVLFGWAPATFVYVDRTDARRAVWRRKPLIRTIFNAGVFGIVGTLAGLVLRQMHGTSPAAILGQVAVDGGDPLLSQPPARHRGDRRLGLGARLRAADPVERPLDDPAVHADGLDAP